MPNNPQIPSLSPAAAMNHVFENTVEQLEAPPNSVTLANLVNAGRVKTISEKSLEWVVKFGKPTAEGIGIYAQSNSQSNSSAAEAKLNIGTKRIAHRFGISRVEASNAAARGLPALQDLLGNHFQEALDAILEKINNAIQVTDTSTEIVSLGTVLDEDASYAGISPVEVPRWVPVVLDNGGVARAFTRDLMLDFDVHCRTFGRSYDNVWMHPQTEYRYRKLFVDAAGTNSLPNFTNLGNLKGVDLGLGNASYNNKPIIIEPALPQGEIRLIRSSAMELFFFDLALSNTSPNAIDEVVNNSLGFPVRICSYPMTVPTILEFEFYTVCQLRVRNRQNALAIRDLTVVDW